MKEENKEGELKLTQEEMDDIMKGIRPEGMPKNIFRQVRRQMNRRINAYKKGRVIHYSREQTEGGDIRGVTHRRTEKRRHQRLGRK